MSRGAAAHTAWEPRLRELAERIRRAVADRLGDGPGHAASGPIDRPVSAGAGDVTYGLDRPAEDALTEWLREQAAREPLSLLSEDAGWRHLGPGPRPGDAPRELPGFDHGGPRIAIDPIDGTRNLMADLRSAWTAIALCPPGRGEPRLADVSLALVAELPDSRAGRHRVLRAAAGEGARLELREVASGGILDERALRADGDDRPDHGYFSFFCYSPAMRPRVAGLSADFHARLERSEGADLRHCYDDQYISNAGQLALLAQGTYRLIADLRALVLEREGGPAVSSKPYDVAAAILVAREAGCSLRSAHGRELDFPLDAATPVSFVGWANEATRERLEPHLAAALEGAGLGASPDARRE